MSASESHIPEVSGPPTWREYPDARLAVLVTKDDLRAPDGTICKAAGLVMTATAVATGIILAVN